MKYHYVRATVVRLAMSQYKKAVIIDRRTGEEVARLEKTKHGITGIPEDFVGRG